MYAVACGEDLGGHRAGLSMMDVVLIGVGWWCSASLTHARDCAVGLGHFPRHIGNLILHQYADPSSGRYFGKLPFML